MTQKRFVHFDEQESHERASQNRARQVFELIKLKCLIVSLDKTLIHRLDWCPLKTFEAALKLSFGP